MIFALETRVGSLLLLLLAASPLMAGEQEVGVIEGIVRLPDGSPWVTTEEHAIALFPGEDEVRPDHDGRFRFENLEPGVYEIAVWCVECSFPTFPDIRVKAGETIEVVLDIDDSVGPPPGPVKLTPCWQRIDADSRWDLQHRIWLNALGLDKGIPDDVEMRTLALRVIVNSERAVSVNVGEGGRSELRAAIGHPEYFQEGRPPDHYRVEFPVEFARELRDLFRAALLEVGYDNGRRWISYDYSTNYQFISDLEGLEWGCGEATDPEAGSPIRPLAMIGEALFDYAQSSELERPAIEDHLRELVVQAGEQFSMESDSDPSRP